MIDLLSTWGGELVEPEYTPNISTTDIIHACFEYEKARKNNDAAVSECMSVCGRIN